MLVRPHDRSILVCLRVTKSIHCPRCATHQAPQRWTLLCMHHAIRERANMRDQVKSKSH